MNTPQGKFVRLRDAQGGDAIEVALVEQDAWEIDSDVWDLETLLEGCWCASSEECVHGRGPIRGAGWQVTLAVTTTAR